MHPLKAMKTVAALMATGATTGETLTASFDTLGYDYCNVDIIMSSAATNKQPAAMAISEGDTTSSYAAITALTGGTAGNTSSFFVIPIGDTSGPNVYSLGIDLRARKRYLKLTVNPATTQSCTMLAKLSRASESPATTTAAGVLLQVHA